MSDLRKACRVGRTHVRHYSAGGAKCEWEKGRPSPAGRGARDRIDGFARGLLAGDLVGDGVVHAAQVLTVNQKLDPVFTGDELWREALRYILAGGLAQDEGVPAEVAELLGLEMPAQSDRAADPDAG